jgi:replicative DNA helicase
LTGYLSIHQSSLFLILHPSLTANVGKTKPSCVLIPLPTTKTKAMTPTPYQTTAEKRLLSCLLDFQINRGLLLQSIPERLFTGNHILIYRAIEALHKAERPVDLVTVHEYLVQNKQPALTDLMGIIDGITITSDWKTYANDLHQMWVNREEQRIMDELSQDRDIPKAFAQYQAIKSTDSAASEITAHELMKEYLLTINEVREGRVKDSVYPTFIRPMDRLLTGFKPSEFILLGGRPAMGKTLLALQIAMNLAMADIPVVFFTMEMSSDQLTQRMLSNLAEMDGAAFLNPSERISTKDFLTLGQKADLMRSKPLYIVDLHQANLDRIEGEIAKLKAKFGIVGFYLDYLQLIEPTKMDKPKTKIEQMTNISKTLKTICKRQKVFGVVVSSLSRASEGRSDHRPLMSDLRETGQLEFDADKIGFVYRPYEHDKTKEADLMEVLWRKNRNGGLGTASIQCHLPLTKANEYPSAI